MTWTNYAKLTNLSLMFAILVLIYHVGMQREYSKSYNENRRSLRSQQTSDCRKQSKTSEGAVSTEWEAVEKRLALRRENLITACKERHLTNESVDVSTTYVRNRFLKAALFFSDKYKILFCQIPKCGTRSQARFLAGMDGLVKVEDVLTLSEAKATALIAKHLSPRNANSLDEVVKKLEGYAKVVIVRDPLSRLLSAFRNKLENNARNDGYASLASRLHTTYGNGSGEKVGGAPVINFDDFLSYLVEDQGSQVDQHWNFYHRLCAPCTIQYQYIVNMDTIDEDMEYIKSRFGIQVPFPRSYDSFTDRLKLQKYFAKANPLLVNKVYHTYELDYKLFGFPPPPQF